MLTGPLEWGSTVLVIGGRLSTRSPSGVNVFYLSLFFYSLFPLSCADDLLSLFYSGDGKVLPREPVHASDDRIFTDFFFSLKSKLRRAIVGRNVPRLVHLAALGPARHTGLFCTL